MLKKRRISLILSIMLSCNTALGACDWSTIEEIQGPKFVYSAVCHDKVGKLVKNEKDYKIQIEAQKKAIELKDLTIQDYKKNSNMWEDEAQKQFNAFKKYKDLEKERTKLWFASGVGATLLIIFLSGQASK